MSMLGISFLNEIVQKREVTQANLVLNELRKQVKLALKQTGRHNETQDGMDIALCVWNEKSKILQYAGANNPLYIIQNKELVEIKADRMPVGYYPIEESGFSNHEIRLNDNDVFYMSTDGYRDQFGGIEESKFKSTRFQQLLLENHLKSMVIQKEIIEKELDKWMYGHLQTDDILVMGVRV
jgi:serine phosphatase RsbU (regulator of sigma subunit)